MHNLNSKNYNPKQFKVAFFGTSDRSIPILEVLKNTYNLCLVITKNDVKYGRKQLSKQTEVKRWAEANRVQYVTTDSLNHTQRQIVIEALKHNKVQLGVVADYSYMIPEEVIHNPPYKLINIHFSMLPYYRGASPVQFSILNGDKKTGITYYIIEKGMDTGDIIFQVEHDLNGTETSGELYSTLFQKAAKNLPVAINNYITKETIPAKQDHSNATYTYSKTHPKKSYIFKQDAEIDWNDSVEKIERQIRAFNPWPISWTTLQELVESNKTTLENDAKLKNPNHKNLKVKIYRAQIDSNKLKIKTLQLEGKKKTDWESFKNGYIVEQ